jgi:serine/threonine protein kinase
MKICDFTLKQWIEERNQKCVNCTNVNDLIDNNLNLNLFRQILYGVSHIHSQKIIHRDLKVFAKRSKHFGKLSKLSILARKHFFT